MALVCSVGWASESPVQVLRPYKCPGPKTDLLNQNHYSGDLTDLPQFTVVLHPNKPFIGQKYHKLEMHLIHLTYLPNIAT